MKHWFMLIFWKVCFGPAQIIDGIINVLTLGSFGCKISLLAAKQLGKARAKHQHAFR